MDNISLSEKVKQYQSGNALYAEDLYNSGFKAAYSIAYNQTYDKEQSVDLAQDTMITVFDNINTLNKAESYIGWVKIIAKNKCINYFRSSYNKHHASFNTVEDEDGNEMEYQIEDERLSIQPEKLLDENTRVEIIKSVLDHLSDDQKTITMMYYYDDMSLKEIAEELGIEMSTVTGRFALAKKNIKKEIEEIQQRDDLKLYNISALPAIPFFISLLGKFKATNSIPTTTISSVVIKKSAEEVIGKSVVKTTAAKATVTTGISTGTKVAITSAIAVAAAGGGYIVVKNLNNTKQQDQVEHEPIETESIPETFSSNGITVTVPEGWNAETSIYHFYDNSWGDNVEDYRDLNAIYLYKDADLKADGTYVVIFNHPDYHTAGGDSPSDETSETIEEFTVGENSYHGKYGPTNYAGYQYNEEVANEYRYQLYLDFNPSSGWQSDYYLYVNNIAELPLNEDSQYRIFFFNRNEETLEDEEIQTILESIQLEKVIGKIELLTDSHSNWPGWLDNEEALYIKKSPSLSDNYENDWMIINPYYTSSYQVFEMRENEGYTWYRIGIDMWITDYGGLLGTYTPNS